MSGIFGVVNHKSSEVKELLTGMGQAMTHRPWYQVDLLHDQSRGIGLGRIGIGIFNQAPQPVWTADRNVALLMAGELYNRQALGQESQALNSDEQLILTLYEQLGPDFVRQLNGAFILAIWDRRDNRLLIANDRFGLYPLFYTCYNGCLRFAPEMKGILSDPSFPRKLDLTALAQYIRFQHLLGQRTFFEDISLLPNACTLVYDLSTGDCKIKPYWTFGDIPHRSNISFAEAVEEAGRLLRCAVQRLSGDAYRPGVYLSGGLDSRTILGLVERRPIASVTYGVQNCRDVHYADRIAKAVGSHHHWFDLPNGEWVKEYADFHLTLTEGYHSWIHAHGITTLSQVRQFMDVNLTGWDGGTVMGHPESIEPLQVRAVDELALTTRLFYLFTQRYTWPSATEGEENLLYCPSIRQNVQGLAFDSFREELVPFLDYRPDVRGEYFYIYHHCRRLTHNLVTFTRSHIEVRFPFFDYELFDFLYALPATLRAERKLFRAVIQREMPRLAYIPYDHDEFLPTTQPLIRNVHAMAIKLKRRFNYHLWPIFPEQTTLYADYENYLRHELRDWAEDILFDRRTTERGLFNPVFLQTLMAHHLSGLEEWTIGKIAPIMTYEMMLRRFYD
jgi:asparagine synthase (glutamine-hydrolysing)